MKTRYVSGQWCDKCEEECYSDPCSKCGASHLGHDLFVFAVLKQEFIEEKKIWWNPLTWRGGYWRTTGLHSRN